MKSEYLIGDAKDVLKTLPDKHFQCVVTSPPYWGLRSYLPDDDAEKKNELGTEQTPEEYVANLVDVFREVKRVLRDDGNVWLNLGDSYASSATGSFNGGGFKDSSAKSGGRNLSGVESSGKMDKLKASGLKPKDLVGIPWRVAFALQQDGWWLRQDIIWCLSGGTYLYVKSQKGIMPMTVKDLYRLDLTKCQLWNGDKWTNILGMNKSKRKGDELEMVLRSGERISCTPNHKFPTERGNIEALEIEIGDVIESVMLPDGNTPEYINAEMAWFIGIYLAEGSKSGSALQIAGHVKEKTRWERIQQMVKYYGGSCTRTISGNKMDIRVYGRIIHAIITEHISGRIAKNKGLSNKCWQYDNKFLDNLLTGYLEGDGHWDKENKRWRLGFTRNYNLERDLRSLSARLGYSITLKPNISENTVTGKKHPSFRGEIRKTVSNHHNNKSRNEVVEIRKARCRYVYDLGVEDYPHTFSLASGILTHNSKPNPMPESVTDRCTKSHEYVFLLTKSARYYYDSDAIRENHDHPSINHKSDRKTTEQEKSFIGKAPTNLGRCGNNPNGRNKRSVWTINTKPYKEAHFAVFPPELPELCIKAGTSAKGQCSKCGNPWIREIEKIQTNKSNEKGITEMIEKGVPRQKANLYVTQKRGTNKTIGWKPTCDCNAKIVPQIVLDPFAGSGTTIMVAKELGRHGIGIDLNDKYREIAVRRCNLDVESVEDFF